MLSFPDMFQFDECCKLLINDCLALNVYIIFVFFKCICCNSFKMLQNVGEEYMVLSNSNSCSETVTSTANKEDCTNSLFIFVLMKKINVIKLQLELAEAAGS